MPVIPLPPNADVVTFTLKSDGTVVGEEIQVTSVVVSRELNKVPFARLVLVDGDPASQDFPMSNKALFQPGKELEILAGYSSQEETIFKGVVTAHKLVVRKNGRSFLKIEARDEATKMTLGRKSKLFENQKDSDALSSIISDAGLRATVESTSVTHEQLAQFQATDWDFVLSRAEANGMVVLANDGELQVKKPTVSGSAVLELAYGMTVMEFDGEIDARTQLDGVETTSWSHTNQAAVQSTSSNPSVPASGNLTGSKLAEVAAPSPFELNHPGALKTEELKAWADGKLLRSRLAKVKGSISCQGNNLAKPNALIKLDGLGERFNGEVYVSGVQHELTEGNWITHIQFGLPEKYLTETHPEVSLAAASGLLPAINGLQVAKVDALEGDPEGENRIKVKLVAFGSDIPGFWARIALLDAGSQRSSFFMPEIGDEVLVGFLNDDPRHPVVLGQLHSSALPPPIEATDDNHIKGFYTRSGMKVEFNDETSIITIETPGGNKTIISDDEQSITVEDQHGNSIKTDSSGIAMSSASDITIEATGNISITATGDFTAEGMNVGLTAQTGFTAEGSASAGLSSSGQTEVKGSIVMIN